MDPEVVTDNLLNRLRALYGQAKELSENEASVSSALANQLDNLMQSGVSTAQRKKIEVNEQKKKRKADSDMPRFSLAVSMRNQLEQAANLKGEQVAARVNADDADNDEWFVVKVMHFDREAKEFEVLDEEPGDDEESIQRKYKLPMSRIIPFPKRENPSTATDFPVGKPVLAVYPGTTALYKATVVNHRKLASCWISYLLEFDDDEEDGSLPQRLVPFHRVVGLPEGHRHSEYGRDRAHLIEAVMMCLHHCHHRIRSFSPSTIGSPTFRSPPLQIIKLPPKSACNRSSLENAFLSFSSAQFSLKQDQQNYAHILELCAAQKASAQGQQIHAHMLKSNNPLDNVFLGTKLVFMYGKCGSLSDAHQVFDEMLDRSVFTWNALIGAYASRGVAHAAIGLYRDMRAAGAPIDACTISLVLKACGGAKNLCCGAEIHGLAIKSGLISVVIVVNSLLAMYAKCDDVDGARMLFDMMPERWDIVSWNSIISAYSQSGKFPEALRLFRDMQEVEISMNSYTAVGVLQACAELSFLKSGMEIHAALLKSGEDGVESDMVSLMSVISACARLSALGKGREIHGFLVRKEFPMDGSLGSSLVDMYASHSGLIDEGKRYLEIMRNDYLLEPWPEHYTCIVDLLGRSALLDDAYEFVKKMPITPTATVWCTLLGACRVHSNNALGEVAARKLLELEPENPGSYVLVSNVFAAAERWKDVEEVRLRMKEKGLRKNPACSWIEVANKVHSFTARDRSHPCTVEIYSKLSEVTSKLEMEGDYVADTKYVLHDVGEEEKRKMLMGHSERLAIAFENYLTMLALDANRERNLVVKRKQNGNEDIVARKA
ncbi:hypothetical protein ACLOJK_032761 [Asimina triloba]